MEKVMTNVINPIVVGYCWGQQFIAPDGTLRPGDELKVEMRDKAGSTPRFILTSGAGLSFTDQTIQVDLTAEQSAYLSNATSLKFDFRVIREGECDLYLSPIVTVPVVLPITQGYPA